MHRTKPFRKPPVPNEANLLLVGLEEQLQFNLAEMILKTEKNVDVTVRPVRKLPLPVNGQDSRPRLDLVVFIVNLMSDPSLKSVVESTEHLDSDFFLGKVCFVATGARSSSTFKKANLLGVKKLSASLHCPLLFMDDLSTEGVSAMAGRLLGMLKVAAGLVPMTTALFLNSLAYNVMPSDLEDIDLLD